MSNLDLDISELGTAYRCGFLRPSDYIDDCLDRIGVFDGRLNTFINIDSDSVRHQVERSENELNSGIDRGPLHGVPIGLKDMIDVAGVPTTCHSKTMLNNIARYDAVVVQRLKAAGAIIVGKLALHELSLGGPSFDLPFPPARNPWNVEHQPGGSSSGPAAAVAAGFVAGAIGSDTAGSIRGPAGHCGVVGLKPTFGLVSRCGTVPLARSLDHLGPIGKTPSDVSLILSAIAGLGGGSKTWPSPSWLPDTQRSRKREITIGFVRHFHESDLPCDPEIKFALEAAVVDAGAATMAVTDIALPPLHLFASSALTILLAEGFTEHGHLIRDRYGDLARRTRHAFLPGAFIRGEQLSMAYQLQSKLRRAVDQALAKVDFLMLANSTALPAPITDDAAIDATLPLQARTVANITGHPCVCVPIGLSESGLPISLQLLGRWWSDKGLLQVAERLTRQNGFRCQPSRLKL